MTGFSVPIYIEEFAGIEREDEPIRIGIPFPEGLVPEALVKGRCQFHLSDHSGNLLPLQTKPLAFWPDKSVKWMLIDFFVSVPKKSKTGYSIVFALDGEASISQRQLTVEESHDTFRVDTGSALFRIHRGKIGPFSSVRLGDVEMLSGIGSHIALTDRTGKNGIIQINESTVEENGCLRCVLRQTGRFILPMKKHVNFTSKLTFFTGKSLVELDFQIHNPKAALHPGGLWDLGDPGSVFFKGLSLNVLANGYVREVEWQAEKNSPVFTSRDADWLLYQDSSGGKNWRSANHVDHTGDLSVSFRGYRIYGEDREKIVGEGRRAAPYVMMHTSKGWIAGTIRNFWQNFPKSLRVANDEICLGIFPFESRSGFELQGGEKKQHSLYLDFGTAEKNTLLPAMHSPLYVYADPEWINETHAVSYFLPENKDQNDTYIEYVKRVIQGPDSFFEKRECIDEYGWRNFGDINADHEAVDHKGSDQFISHYNNQYDFVYGAFVQFLRTGERAWFELMRDAAEHHMDIDLYHTDEDKSAYNHGFFWHTDHHRHAATATHRTYSRKTLKNSPIGNYGGGPSNEHNYTSGFLHYYYISGDTNARDAVLSLAGWVINMDDGSRNILGFIDEGSTGLASQTAAPDFHKPGRGAGNSINALMDAYRLTGTRVYLEKAQVLIQRCIHPEDDITSLSLDEPEYRWSYLLFLQVLGKYLDLKFEIDESDYHYYYARDSLLHYADWMIENEKPYYDVLHKVDIPTETWPAQDIRKCHIFHLASKYGQAGKTLDYDDKAKFYFDRCLTDLQRFETAFLTRPLVILTVYGYIHGYFQKCADRVGYRLHNHMFGFPENFIPQKKRLKMTFIRKLREMMTVTSRLLSTKWYQLFAQPKPKG